MKSETSFEEGIEDKMQFLKFMGDTHLIKFKKITREVTEEVVVEESIRTISKKETHIISLMKSKALQDDFLREVIPTKKDTNALKKMWGSGKDLFKSRGDIFKDDWVE